MFWSTWRIEEIGDECSGLSFLRGSQLNTSRAIKRPLALGEHKMKNQLIRRSFHAALFMSSAAIALPLWAADTEVNEVIVTGSRIVNRDAAADTPIMTVSSETITDSGYV